MTMPLQTLDLWNLVRKRPQIDPRDLTEAICGEVRHITLDYRTQLLIRDSVEALRLHWGAERLGEWLNDCPEREQIQTICQERFDKIGYPSLRNRLMEKTDPDKIREFFGYLGNKLTRNVRVEIAGSVALILSGYLSRHTEDIDVVGEVPSAIREDHRLTDALESTYGLKLAHVQSRYFPKDWQKRVHSFDIFDQLHVFLVDVYDVALSKLFSARLKDFQDLSVLKPQLDKDVITDRLLSNTTAWLTEPRLKKLAQDNWQILYGEALPQ